MENEKTKKQEELQSRRDFFKKTVKGVLPIIGAIVLANSPLLAKADKIEMGCTGTCYGTCKGSCEGCTCTGDCKNACTSCRYTCSGGCKNTSR